MTNFSAIKAILDFNKAANTHFNILSLLLFCLPCLAFAQDKIPAGEAIASIGSVKAGVTDKTERALKRGDSFYGLEKIIVGAASKAQLKFSDGGIVNLIAQTEYKVDSYVYKDPNKKSEFLSTLVKGGFRAVTGSIGKENPSGTRIRTALATIGVRGTIFEAILANRRLSVRCEEGKISVKNAQGEVEIGPQSATLYAIVEEGKAPIAVKEMPADLAAVSFNIEGGIPFGTQAAAPSSVSQPPSAAQEKPYSPQGYYARAEDALVPGGFDCAGAGSGAGSGRGAGRGAGRGEGAGAGSGMGAGYGQGAADQEAFGGGYPDLNAMEQIDGAYDMNEAGFAYNESQAASFFSPKMAIGAVCAIGIIIIVYEKTKGHHHHSSSSYSSSRSSSSSSYHCPSSCCCHY